ncbi:MAG: cytochrome C oxidase subunit IV family protein [Pirellulales bacterium]|nr:cytochrome C oxidase subunit IV family protein [Pirellulales bacterium]
MNETTNPTNEKPGAHATGGVAHVADPRVLLAVFAALIGLTALTVGVSYFDFGGLNIFVALGVATVKAGLVALYFMHLRYDNLFNSVVFLTGVAFLGLFLGITLLDTVEYQPGIETFQESQLK